MFIDFFNDIFSEKNNSASIIWKHNTYNYSWLLGNINKFLILIDEHKIIAGTVVGVEGDFTPNSISLIFALIEKECIVVPLSNRVENKKQLDISKVETFIIIDNDDNFIIKPIAKRLNNKYYDILRERRHPGLVLFTSGTSGLPKAAVHDFLPLLEKFKKRKKALRTLNFLFFDHWGGLNTMFHILSSGGVVILTKNRNPVTICQLIEQHKVELLPVSPTFLNLLLLSGSYKDYYMKSLKIISYGTEPMPKNTLTRVSNIFPDTKLMQTYGLIELGVMSSKSKKDDSLWIKVGGDGYKTRIINGMLEIKARSAMLGYLNMPSPFTHDGWFKTGDSVEVNGEYIKIIGRKSEIINVGGDKVFPQEVENVILGIDNVSTVTVYGEKNPIMGNIVCAKVSLKKDQDKKAFIKLLQKHCSRKLQKFKVPIKVIILKDINFNKRFKKNRIKEDASQ